MSTDKTVTKRECMKVSDCGRYGIPRDSSYPKGGGELWKLGPHGYMAGYISDPDNIESAVDEAEEEMHFLMAEFAQRRESAAPSWGASGWIR